MAGSLQVEEGLSVADVVDLADLRRVDMSW
jgi:hypothetical protein